MRDVYYQVLVWRDTVLATGYSDLPDVRRKLYSLEYALWRPGMVLAVQGDGALAGDAFGVYGEGESVSDE